MQRTQISLTPAERSLLDAEAARTGQSLSALIREAVARTYGPGRPVADDVSAIKAALGAWSGRGVDGQSYVERIRSGTRLNGADQR